jgi:hypothetical protein
MCRDMKQAPAYSLTLHMYMPSTACALRIAGCARVTLLEDGRLSKLFASGSVQPTPNR